MKAIEFCITIPAWAPFLLYIPFILVGFAEFITWIKKRYEKAQQEAA